MLSDHHPCQLNTTERPRFLHYLPRCRCTPRRRLPVFPTLLQTAFFWLLQPFTEPPAFPLPIFCKATPTSTLDLPCCWFARALAHLTTQPAVLRPSQHPWNTKQLSTGMQLWVPSPALHVTPNLHLDGAQHDMKRHTGLRESHSYCAETGMVSRRKERRISCRASCCLCCGRCCPFCHGPWLPRCPLLLPRHPLAPHRPHPPPPPPLLFPWLRLPCLLPLSGGLAALPGPAQTPTLLP